MRLLALSVALILIALAGCDKADDHRIFAATYKGTFFRNDGLPHSDPIVSNVTLHLSEKTFTGTNDVRNYPMICSGSFTISQTKMVVSNNCYFTADFDWTYIFNGEYNYELNGNQLRIWRTYASGASDIYQLTKEE